jgi:hypothetical protein
LITPNWAIFAWEGRSEPPGMATGSRPDATIAPPDDATLIWYSDGVVERRDVDITDGMNTLAFGGGPATRQQPPNVVPNHPHRADP